MRMGSSEFEDMAVALCAAEFGSGGQTFGTGPDGGREWTYNGQLPMPALPLDSDDAPTGADGSRWSGYTVIQAKYRERLEGGAADHNWLLNEIQKEVNKWTKKDRPRSPKPTNFLVISNVRLSAVQTKGGVDVVSAKMAEHAKTMKLKGWAVWHSAHLSRLLDNHTAVRQTYLGLIVTGDILAALLDQLVGINPDAAAALTGFIAKELRAYNNVRLTQAGNGPDKEWLSDIGIDLPALDRNNPVDDKGNQVHHFIAQNLIFHGDHPRRVQGEDFATVLIGGPGQGKSTVGQLICQAYRVAILEGRAAKLTHDHRRILEETRSHLNEIGVPLPNMHRWPIYVRLTEYSERILGAQDYSLRMFITDEINKRGGPHRITQAHLYSWLRMWPWLLVLDGLDEVPDAHTRSVLLEKISEFALDAAEQNADISILATTRRQGYENDLRSLQPREFELLQLTKKQAMEYGRKLANSRHRDDLLLADEIHKRLIAASTERMTAKLLGSPLQVSIMTSLLEENVRPPRTKHALFSAFYETVFKRESAKLGLVGTNVQQYKAEIDALHDAAGMLLHIETEKSGRADVHLAREDLKALATEHLVAQTYAPEDAGRVAETLIGLATDRLILLVESSVNKWGFEVRSFQEFMASRYLTSGPEEEILGRLRLLAKSSHWRNTWLFAAAEVYGNRLHLREKILSIVMETDSRSMAEHLAKPGSVLAADMLMDNFAGDTPGLHKQLLNQVLDILDTPLMDQHLIPVLHEAAEKDHVYRRRIEQSFNDAIAAGGLRKLHMQSLMRLWAKRFTGAIPAFVRSRMDVRITQDDYARKMTLSPRYIVRVSDEQDHPGGPLRTMRDAFAHVRRDDLPQEEQITLDDFLTSAAKVGLTGGLMLLGGLIGRDVPPEIMARIVGSTALCSALADAAESLPDSDSVASDWLIGQIAQFLGQERVGNELETLGPVPRRSIALTP